MAHDHRHHDHSHAHSHATGNIKFAFFINLIFALVEIVGGLFTNSVAIMSDALHDLGDSFSLGLAWYFQGVSNRKRDAAYSYGYRRFSLAGAFINSLVLLTGSVFVMVESIKRLGTPEPVDARGMLLLAIFGIAINLLAMLRLRKGDSLNERVVSLHFLEDVLGWVAVLIGSIVMLFADVPLLDPILSLGIACYILFNVFRNMRQTVRIVLQAVPSTLLPAEIEKQIVNVPGVDSIHDMHIWTMDGTYNVLTMHVAIDPNMNNESVLDLKKEIRHRLAHCNIHHATIETEPTGTVCNDQCE